MLCLYVGLDRAYGIHTTVQKVQCLTTGSLLHGQYLSLALELKFQPFGISNQVRRSMID